MLVLPSAQGRSTQRPWGQVKTQVIGMAAFAMQKIRHDPILRNDKKDHAFMDNRIFMADGLRMDEIKPICRGKCFQLCLWLRSDRRIEAIGDLILPVHDDGIVVGRALEYFAPIDAVAAVFAVGIPAGVDDE